MDVTLLGLGLGILAACVYMYKNYWNRSGLTCDMDITVLCRWVQDSEAGVFSLPIYEIKM